MQITIDTQKDSKEDIRKAIALLSSLADGTGERHSNIFESSDPSVDLPGSESSSEGSNAFVDMFGESSTSTKETPEETPILPVNTEETESVEDDDSPEIVQY